MDFKEKQSHLSSAIWWNLIPCLYRLSVLPHTSQTIIAHDVTSVGWQDLFILCLIHINVSCKRERKWCHFFFFHVQFKLRDNGQIIGRYQNTEPIMTNNKTKKVKGDILHQGQCPLLHFQIKDSVLHWMGSSFVRVPLSSRATKPRVVVFCFFLYEIEHTVQWELYFGKVWKRRREHSAETSRAAWLLV